MLRSELQDRMRVVYYDERYPTNWISRTDAKIISDNLERGGFIEMNAQMIGEWIDRRKVRNDAISSVLVMAQDVAPDTVFERISEDCRLRHYLNSGGRVVWVGDIPFYARGIETRTEVTEEARVKFTDRDPIGLMGQYAVLGSLSADATPEGQVEITSDGREQGLKTGWYSSRPVASKFVKNGKILASTRLLPRSHIDDILPQRISYQERDNAILSATGANQFVDAISNIATFVAIVASILLLALSFQYRNLSPQQISFVAVAIAIIVIAAVRYFLQKRRAVFASAWLAKFGKGGEFVRIWDYGSPILNQGTLAELSEIATHGR